MVILGWFFLYGKVKAQSFLSPILDRLPKDELGLVKMTDSILGAAIEKIEKGTIKKLIEEKGEYLEDTEYAKPVVEIRENIKERTNEVIESIKELPAKEIRIIQEEVCRQWMAELTPTVTKSP